MSAKTTLPGYMGYIPAYQVEYPMNKQVPAYKYEDVNAERQVIKSRGRWSSNYTNSIDPAVIRDPRMDVEVPQDNKLLQRFKEIKEVRQSLQAKRDVHEYESRPPTNWGTTYGAQFNGWKQDRESRARQRRSRSAQSENERNMSDYRQQQAVSRPVLQGVDHPSSYTRSFGPRGHDPRHHYVVNDGRDVFSRRATTKDLFSGSTKGSIRVPGYQGYVPDSRNNVNTIRDNMPGFTKNNIIETYRYQMPGYTGCIRDLPAEGMPNRLDF